MMYSLKKLWSNVYLFLIIKTFVLLAFTNASDDKYVICYIRSWAIYRQSFPFNVDNIDPSLCTHLVYLFAGLSGSAEEIISKINHIDLPDNNGHDMYRKITSLKNKNSNLKVMLSVGGSGEPSINFSRLSQSNKKRKNFARNAVAFLRNYNFDGLEIYWFYPGSTGRNEDKDNFPLLLQELKTEFRTNSLLLSVVLSGSKVVIDKGYDIPAIAKYVDWMNINVYNYHTPNEAKFGIHAPLNSNNENNIKFSVDYILKKGGWANKTVLRLGVHGYGYSNVDSMGNFANGIVGLYPEDRGFLTIFEICENLDSGWQSSWDNDSSTPIARKGSDRISYDDQKSLKIKASYALDKKVLGIGFSSLDVDDFQGICGYPGYGNDHRYPLLKALRSEFNKNKGSTDQKGNDSSITVTVLIHTF